MMKRWETQPHLQGWARASAHILAANWSHGRRGRAGGGSRASGVPTGVRCASGLQPCLEGPTTLPRTPQSVWIAPGAPPLEHCSLPLLLPAPWRDAVRQSSVSAYTPSMTAAGLQPAAGRLPPPPAAAPRQPLIAASLLPLHLHNRMTLQRR